MSNIPIGKTEGHLIYKVYPYQKTWEIYPGHEFPNVPGANVSAGVAVMVNAARDNPGVVGAALGTVVGGGNLQAIGGAVLGQIIGQGGCQPHDSDNDGGDDDHDHSSED